MPKVYMSKKDLVVNLKSLRTVPEASTDPRLILLIERLKGGTVTPKKAMPKIGFKKKKYLKLFKPYITDEDLEIFFLKQRGNDADHKKWFLRLIAERILEDTTP